MLLCPNGPRNQGVTFYIPLTLPLSSVYSDSFSITLFYNRSCINLGKSNQNYQDWTRNNKIQRIFSILLAWNSLANQEELRPYCTDIYIFCVHPIFLTNHIIKYSEPQYLLPSFYFNQKILYHTYQVSLKYIKSDWYNHGILYNQMINSFLNILSEEKSISQNEKRGSFVCILLLKFRFSEKATKSQKRLVVINLNLKKFAIANFFY